MGGLPHNAGGGPYLFTGCGDYELGMGLKGIQIIGRFNDGQPLVGTPTKIIGIAFQRNADNAVGHTHHIIAP